MLSHEKNKLKQKGFTLIELLVVITIIALLASVITYAVTTARKKGRDARRMADMATFEKAMNLYYQDKGYYPPMTSGLAYDFFSNKTDLINALIPAGGTPYITSIPQDPSCPSGGAASCTYQLQYSPNGTTPTSYGIEIFFENIAYCKRISPGASAATFFPAVPVCSY